MSPSSHNRAAWLGVAATVGIAFVARWRFLDSIPWPTGIDGFYYAVQLRSLLEGRGLYYPASPMVFWLLLPGAWAFGPIGGLKIGAALGTALAAVPVHAIVSRATGNRVAGLLGSAIIATAAGSFYLSTEFVKQGVGLTLALCFVAALASALDARETGKRRAWVAAAAALFVMTLLSHMTSVGIAVIFGLPLVWMRVRRPMLVGIALLLVLAMIVMLVPAARQEMGMRQLFGAADFDFLGDHSFHHEVELGFLAAAACAAAAFFAWREKRIEPETLALLAGPIILGLTLAIPWLSVRDGQGLINRLRVMAFVPLAICGPAALAFLLALRAPRLERLVPLAAVVMVMTLVPLRYTEAALAPGRATDIPALKALRDHTPENAIIAVIDRFLSYQVKWFADREARMRPPPSAGGRPVYRLITPGVLPPRVLGGLDSLSVRLPAEVARPVLLHAGKPRLYLISDPAWQALLRVVGPEDRAKMEPWPGIR